MKRKTWNVYDRFNIEGLSRDEFRTILKHAPPDDLKALLRAAGSQDVLPRPFKKRKHSRREISQRSRAHAPLPTESDGASDPVGCFSSLEGLSPGLALSIAQGRVDYFLRQRSHRQPTAENPDTGSYGASSRADFAAGLDVAGVDSIRCGHELRLRHEQRSRLQKKHVKTLLGCFHRLNRPSNDLGDALELVDDETVCDALRRLETALEQHDRHRTTAGGVGGESGAAWQHSVALTPGAIGDKPVRCAKHRSQGDDGPDRGTADVANKGRERKPYAASDQIEAAHGSPLNEASTAGDGQALEVLEGHHRNEAVLESYERGSRATCITEPVSSLCGRDEDTRPALQSLDSAMRVESRAVGTTFTARSASTMDVTASRIMPKGTSPAVEKPKARKKKKKKKRRKKRRSDDLPFPGEIHSKVEEEMNHGPRAAPTTGSPQPSWHGAGPQHAKSIANGQWPDPVPLTANEVWSARDRRPDLVNHATKKVMSALAGALQEARHPEVDGGHSPLQGSEHIAGTQSSATTKQSSKARRGTGTRSSSRDCLSERSRLKEPSMAESIEREPPDKLVPEATTVSIRLTQDGEIPQHGREKCEYKGVPTSVRSEVSQVPEPEDELLGDDTNQGICQRRRGKGGVGLSGSSARFDAIVPAERATSASATGNPSKTKILLASPYFKHRNSRGSESCIPFPPVERASFGLIQETLADDPFQLLVAAMFLNRTRGIHAIPAFHKLISLYPTADRLAKADEDELAEAFRHLGLQNIRARRYIELAKVWVRDPPTRGRRHRKLHYPSAGDGKDIKPRDIVGDDDARVGAWEVAHLPSAGPYAIDSWRVFCRDRLRGLATGWNGEGAESTGFEPEWKRVLPKDKELRAFIRWMWLKDGVRWDPLTGDKVATSPRSMAKAGEGHVTVDDPCRDDRGMGPPCCTMADRSDR